MWEAVIKATCDGCNEIVYVSPGVDVCISFEDTIEKVEKELEEQGWIMFLEGDFCPACAAKRR